MHLFSIAEWERVCVCLHYIFAGAVLRQREIVPACLRSDHKQSLFFFP